MRARNPVFAAAALVLFGIVHGCGQGAAPEADGIEVFNPLAHPEYGPPAGNPDGDSPIPAEAGPAAITAPDHVIGNGTPESCTAQAFLDAVAQGGTIVFNGGTEPFTIRLEQQAVVFNDANPDVVIDGAGLVTLDGNGVTRILYMNTCDPDLVWTTPHCDDQDHPRLTVQNLTFANGNAINDDAYDGGGAIWVRGGRFKAVNCRFFNNRCAYEGPDVGGGAIRVFDQYQDLPVYLVNCTFGGGDGFGNVGANGGAISSIGVSWTIINCLFAGNRAVGSGGNPAQQGTPGGGSGGAIYNDGNTMTLDDQRLPDRGQRRECLRRGDLLRHQRPQREHPDRGFRDPRQHGRLVVPRAPGHFDARGHAVRGGELDDRVAPRHPRYFTSTIRWLRFQSPVPSTYR
jgi:hypothetical protein